jgi:hypothetical protein
MKNARNFVSMTGRGLVFCVRGHLTSHGFEGIGQACDLGNLDAPSTIPAGSVRIVTIPEADGILHSLPTATIRP